MKTLQEKKKDMFFVLFGFIFLTSAVIAFIYGNIQQGYFMVALIYGGIASFAPMILFSLLILSIKEYKEASKNNSDNKDNHE